jgi:hypothetical protein
VKKGRGYRRKVIFRFIKKRGSDLGILIFSKIVAFTCLSPFPIEAINSTLLIPSPDGKWKGREGIFIQRRALENIIYQMRAAESLI